MLHPWVIARSDDALEVMDAWEAAALRRQKMPPEVVRSILADPRAYGVIAEECRVPYQMVAQIKSRRVYAHVPYDGEIPRGARGGGLDPRTARNIFLDPATPREIAARHGVSVGVVRQIKQRVAHAHATRDMTPPPPSTRETLRAELRALKARYDTERAALLAKLGGEA